MSYCVGILSGGKSSRMGENKAFLEYQNHSFLEKIIGEFAGKSITVSADKPGVYEETCQRKGVSLVYDVHREIGPMEGIYQILTHAEEEYVFICAVDMPFLKREVADYLYEFVSSDYDCICVRDEGQIHPLCAIYSVKIIEQLETLIQDGKFRLMELLNRIRTKYVSLEFSCFDKKVVRNINTKEEYRQCLFPIVFAVSGTKNNGKTILIEKLIPKFTNEGYRVGVIKHDGHDYAMDHPGTDTERFSRAGALYSTIYSKTKYTVQANFSLEEKEVEKLIGQMDQADVIILEGQKNSAYPKVEVVRKEVGRKPVCKDPLICIATDAKLSESPVPSYDIDDTDGIYNEIRKYFDILE
jgi:molybdopterin-guanine dinucleotide biosynthesis protein